MGRTRSQLWRWLVPGLVLGLASCVGGGEASNEEVVATSQASSACAPAEPSATRLLRQLSLDLRGAPPSIEEIEATQRTGQVSPEQIDTMLRSDSFLDQAGRWHADLLWPNLDGFLVRAGGLRLTRGGTNPENVLETLDARTNESTCPTNSTTAVVCCTSQNPTHPACCGARNTAYNANDPACLARSRAMPAVYTVGQGVGDRPLRGGSGSTGCDENLEYPPTRVASTDTRWLRDSTGRPYYISPRSGQRRYYYDQDEVPLPYDDHTHCPNFCRRIGPGSAADGSLTIADYVSKQRTVNGQTVNGDHPDARCPTGFEEVVNTCDNALANGNDYNVRVRREGYVLQRTYWSGGRYVKMCAYEAQERNNSVYTGQLCAPANRLDPSCGCGPEGMFCMPSQGRQSPLATRAERRVREALNQEPLRIVRSVIGRDEDYYAIYSTRRSFITGPLAFFYRNQVDRSSGINLAPPVPTDQMPTMGYEDDTWREYVRGAEHAGVLTTPAWLGRFPTQRARINRFRSALLCRPFEPPAGGLPAPEDACNREPNLAHRCGCQHCHASIEPLGAYWGRWSERSAVYLDPQSFPAFDPNCATCAITGQFCTPRCRANYVTTTLDADGSRYAGTLFGYLYRSQPEQHAIDEGPSGLVSASLASGEMQACTVNTVWRRLVGRTMNEQEARDVMPGLLQRFQASNNNYRALVRDIVTAPAYRRID
ncbi:MAG: hypothetical protein JNK72_23215 [Myxococcales bacterium]|nr:hypothetical protein [Myxococcales bacterium]